MKELKGSKKQIKWANDIREDLLNSLNQAIQRAYINLEVLKEENREERIIRYYSKCIIQLEKKKLEIEEIESAAEIIKYRFYTDKKGNLESSFFIFEIELYYRDVEWLINYTRGE